MLLATVMRAAPAPMTIALALIALFRPFLPASELPSKLPTRPPSVKEAVTAENSASVRGMHVGSPRL